MFINLLVKEGFSFFTGVPCSIFKDFLACLNSTAGINHFAATSEGEACAIAAGSYLASKSIPVVYMQNSGLGNSINPLTSLMDKSVYGMPALLLISWRGKPGLKDEPEHTKMGEIITKLLETLNIPYGVLPPDAKEAARQIKIAKEYLRKNNLPYAIIVGKGTFAPYECPIKNKKDKYFLTREEAIGIIGDYLRGGEAVVSTTGKTSRELFEYRKTRGFDHEKDFYMVGSMGCLAGIALGMAFKKPKKKIIVLDGDGALLMKMGTLATIGHYAPRRFCHFVFDNNAYDSTGGQQTVSDTVEIGKVALACGYKEAKIISTRQGLINCLRQLKNQPGPSMVVVKVRKGARKDLGRPTLTPQENKIAFMRFMQK